MQASLHVPSDCVWRAGSVSQATTTHRMMMLLCAAAAALHRQVWAGVDPSGAILRSFDKSFLALSWLGAESSSTATKAAWIDGSEWNYTVRRVGRAPLWTHGACCAEWLVIGPARGCGWSCPAGELRRYVRFWPSVGGGMPCNRSVTHDSCEFNHGRCTP